MIQYKLYVLLGGIKLNIKLNNGCLFLPEPLSEDLSIKGLIPLAKKSFFKLQKNPNLHFNGKKIIIVNKNNQKYPWERKFDHLITEQRGAFRVFSKSRLQRLLWIEEILTKCYPNECSKLIINKRMRKKLYHKLECSNIRYRVILGEDEDVDNYFLITAYPVKEKDNESEKVLLRKNKYR